MGLHIKLNKVSKIYPVGLSAAEDLVDAASDNTSKKNGKVAVNDVSLILREGDRLGIVGRNGAGKSTLLHMIAGISNPTYGDISIKGKVTSILTLGIGLRDDLSGRENIYIDGEIQGKTREEIDQVIDQIIEFSELEKFIDFPIRSYSTGMKARLAFSMITHIDPEILIIDEALSVGDAAFSKKATARILEICARGKIVILVSHGMQSIKDICNRCIYLKDGAIVLDGTPDVVTKFYIDEVHDEDEAILLERFSRHVGSYSFVNSCTIDSLKMFAVGDSKPAIKFESGAGLKIEIKAGFMLSMESLACVVSIVRLDDLVLFHHIFDVDEYLISNIGMGIELEFLPLTLASGIYRLEVELCQKITLEHKTLAKASSIFEVFSLSPPSGGMPMLYYPIHGNSKSA